MEKHFYDGKSLFLFNKTPYQAMSAHHLTPEESEMKINIQRWDVWMRVFPLYRFSIDYLNGKYYQIDELEMMISGQHFVFVIFAALKFNGAGYLENLLKHSSDISLMLFWFIYQCKSGVE